MSRDFIELLSPHGQDPLGNWRVGITGINNSTTITPKAAVQKVYDSDFKGNLFAFNGGSGVRMQLPKEGDSPLAIVQPFLVLQVLIPQVRRWRSALRD